MRYKLSDFLPLITVLSVITAFTLLRQWLGGWQIDRAMTDFMGSFFIVFGVFKLLNWHGFAKAYQEYDIIAKRSVAYAYAYPVLEIALGSAYFMTLSSQHFFLVNLAAFILMVVSSIGVALELAKGKEISCACLGVVFKIPMTYVTLLEDLLMAAMALYMLLR